MRIFYANTENKHNSLKSSDFDDFYSSLHDAFSEKNYVFLDANNISERLENDSPESFSILETGFGTGLNLIITLDIFLKHNVSKNNSTILHFVSTELYPLSKDTLSSSLYKLNTNEELITQLLEQLPPAIKGYHRIIFNKGSAYLTLLIGDAAHEISRWSSHVNALFLDGFSPTKNPEMWSNTLFNEIAKFCKPSTTFSTYTASSTVRNNLKAQGFKVLKRPGFGKKREMLYGMFDKKTYPSSLLNPPWFSIPTTQKPKTAIIIGAGLAGCTTAEALARRGIAVTLIDTHADICHEASGNKQGALYAKLPTSPTKSGEFHLCGLEYSLRLLKIYDCLDDKTASQCGLLQLATSERELERQHATLRNGHYAEDVVRSVSAEEASELSGNLIDRPALFFPRAGWVYPKAFCEKLVANNLITMQLSTTVTSINKNADKGWQLITENQQIFSADILVVCTAAQAKSFEPLNHFPVKPIRGQVSTVAASNQSKLKTVVCGDGYISPALEGSYSFGATFDLHDQSASVREADHISNVAMLKSALPILAEEIEQLPWTAKVGYRCSTPDYLPITGFAPIAEDFRTRYAKLADDKNWKFPDIAPPLHEGLLVNIGHGSKGLITAPLCAELLASLVTNEPLPVPRDIYQALHPGRFLIKNLIRNK